MKRRTILFLLPVLLLFLAGCSDEAVRAANMGKTSSDGLITVAENDIDLGTIRMSSGNVDIPFIFRNDGTESVVLIEGVTSCMCTEAVVRKSDGTVSPRMKMPGHGPIVRLYRILEPGEQADLIATFDPNAHGPGGVGPITRDIILTTNSRKTPKVTFRFRGTVVP